MTLPYARTAKRLITPLPVHALPSAEILGVIPLGRGRRRAGFVLKERNQRAAAAKGVHWYTRCNRMPFFPAARNTGSRASLIRVLGETMLNFIRTTKTKTGLRVKAYLDRRDYPKGLKVSEDCLSALRITYL